MLAARHARRGSVARDDAAARAKTRSGAGGAGAASGDGSALAAALDAARTHALAARGDRRGARAPGRRRAVDALPRLQYRAAPAAERSLGIVPPPGGGETAHAELAAALASARDATAEVVRGGRRVGGGDAAGRSSRVARAPSSGVRLARVRLARSARRRAARGPSDAAGLVDARSPPSASPPSAAAGVVAGAAPRSALAAACGAAGVRRGLCVDRQCAHRPPARAGAAFAP